MSYPFNWVKIVKDLDELNSSNELLAVFLLLTEGTILHCCGPEYREVTHELLMEMKQIPSLIFVYEDNLLGNFSRIELRRSKDHNVSKDVEKLLFAQYQKEGAVKPLER